MGGFFDKEEHAAIKINLLCEQFGIKRRNPTINMDDIQKKKEKTSKYKGVYSHKQNGKWRVQLSIKGQKAKYGGIFKNELEAAKKANQLCEELGIPIYNPEISAIPSQQYQHDDCNTIGNPVIGSEISQTDTDDPNKN